MPDREDMRLTTRPVHFLPSLSRRDFLKQTGMGFGSLALAYLLAQEAYALLNTEHRTPQMATLADLCHILYNVNEFVYVD